MNRYGSDNDSRVPMQKPEPPRPGSMPHQMVAAQKTCPVLAIPLEALNLQSEAGPMVAPEPGDTVEITVTGSYRGTQGKVGMVEIEMANGLPLCGMESEEPSERMDYL